MKKATLYCNEESVFLNNLLVHRPIMPSPEMGNEHTNKIEVNILEVSGENALVLLPNIAMNSEQDTVLVNLQYLH